MSMRRFWLALALVVGVSTSGTAGEVTLTVVNVVTPQDVKIWEPTSLFAKKGDSVMLNLINRHQDEHGHKVAAFDLLHPDPRDPLPPPILVPADQLHLLSVPCLGRQRPWLPHLAVRAR